MLSAKRISDCSFRPRVVIRLDTQVKRESSRVLSIEPGMNQSALRNVCEAKHYVSKEKGIRQRN